ncbi:tryptophan-rich sensory protein [Alkalibacter mobilis]|uniref:tryptophan-rich sensory protein n=1 Tax=Alkalibacter mobilis TaxID=2787712 RepID=UPI00189DCC17|nr:tryptophan-rich sensory protein [Alkalibacter mobilis]MBF7096404.1 tryptophan-rich sensory protein [Alkalibacter mobilis]
MFNDRIVPAKLKAANTLGLILVLVVNALANILPINGFNTGEISDFYPNLFTPSGYVFSIWGLIYFFLIVFVVYGYDFFGRKSDKKVVENIGWLFLISCVLNAAWLVLWHYLYVEYSLVVMILLLLVLLLIYDKIHSNIFADPNNKFFVGIPFSLYTGWITVATIANVTALLVHLEWSGFGLSEELWTILILMVATFIIGTFVVQKNDIVYGAVYIWTLSGIIYKHQFQFEFAYPGVVVASYASVAVIFVLFLLNIRKRKKIKSRFFG